MTKSVNPLSDLNNKIIIRNENNNYRNLTWLDAQINNDSILRNEGKTWYLNSTLSLDNAQFWINNSDCDRLIMSNQVHGTRYGTGGLPLGKLYIDNTYICSWDYNESCIPDPFDVWTWWDGESEYYNGIILNEDAFNDKVIFSVVTDGGWINNSSFEGVQRVKLNTVFNRTVSNITYKSGYGSFSLNGCNNLTLDGATVQNISLGQGVSVNGGGHVTVKNVSIFNAAGGVVFSSDYCIMENITTNLTDWMALEVDGGATGCVIRNVYVNRARHNAIDIHGASDLLIENASLYNSTSNSVLLTGSGSDVGKTWNITLRDIYTYNSSFRDPRYPTDGLGGTGIALSANDTTKYPVENITMINITCDSEDHGLELHTIDNVSVYNLSVPNCSDGVFCSQKVRNLSIIDSDLTGTIGSNVHLYNNSSMSVINTQYGYTLIDLDTNSLTSYYYANPLVKNLTSFSVENAIITSNLTVKNGNGINQTSFISGINGKLYDDCNRSNLIAVPELTKTKTTTIYHTPLIAAEKDGLTDSDILDPDSTWQSASLSSLSAPETVLVLDVTGGEPEEPDPILPDSLFSANATTGDSPLIVLFSDSSTGYPTTWFWDFGDETTSYVQNPVHTYLESGTYTVSLTTSNVNGSDTLTQNNYIDVTFPENEVDANFTATPTNGTIRLLVQFNDTSTGNPTSWAWDFDNNGVIDSTSRNASRYYKTPGNYTVNLTVSNEYEENSEVKTNYIIAEKQNYIIIIFDWFSDLFLAGGVIRG